jgi:hypothetical protein
VLRAVLARHELRGISSTPETTRRRGITFSPSRGSRVILTARTSTGASGPAVTPADPVAA